MDAPERLDFLVYYRKQLQTIIDKLDRQIKKTQTKNKVEDENLFEEKKDITDPKFLEAYVTNPGVIDALGECRDFLRSISETEQDRNGLLYYSNPKQGKRFAMLALSPRRLNLYIAPRLGLYDKLPDTLCQELRFGKSSGDRWDKFQFTSQYQAKKAITYLKSYFEGSGENLQGKGSTKQ